ncbi:LEA type 2 family protein [Spongiibacter sp. KMU-158]|uniref:LEA type 2 family protein n=1 Tax=Spongiibacter pelagi TaxID=2760804 RepID=A0A927GUC5_9GAMM|nr:LEA type 2 family protein [Spongiibacter pelagi]MBD2857461.1 LEA type 2 family protein [Spongiibacter pelagi]
MKIFVAVLSALLLSACASVNPIAKPEVAVTNIQVGANNGFQQTLKVGLQLDNPNGFDINLGRFRYDIALAGNSLAGGSFNEAVMLPANDRVNLVVPVQVNLLSGLGLIRSLLNAPQDQLEYELSLTANVLNFGFGDVTVSKKGLVGIGLGSTPQGTAK